MHAERWPTSPSTDLVRTDKYKARLVAQGFSQVEGIDYRETFMPVTKVNSISILLALSAHFDWEIHRMDVGSAFLNAELDEEIYSRVLQSYSRNSLAT